MATFILMTKLAPELAAKFSERAEIGGAWLDEVHDKCPSVKFVAHYGLLGQYDFMDIYEAPDEETALPYKRIVELSKEI